MAAKRSPNETPKCAIWGFLTPVSTPQPSPKSSLLEGAGVGRFQRCRVLGGYGERGSFCPLPAPASTITSEGTKSLRPSTYLGTTVPALLFCLRSPLACSQAHLCLCKYLGEQRSLTHSQDAPVFINFASRIKDRNVTVQRCIWWVGGGHSALWGGQAGPCNGFRPQERENGPPKTWISPLVVLSGSELCCQL